MARVTWPSSATTENCRSTKARWPAPWASASLPWRIGCRGRIEHVVGRTFADLLVMGRHRRKSPGVDQRRVFLAVLRACGAAVAGPAEWAAARSPLHVRVGDLVRGSLSCVRSYRASGQPASALGGRTEPAAHLRLVLHYDFVPACFSSASRMNGIVSRRCATKDASSRASRTSNSDGK